MNYDKKEDTVEAQLYGRSDKDKMNMIQKQMQNDIA